jgi:hypothetical protein
MGVPCLEFLRVTQKARWLSNVPFLFLSFETNILTTLRIIDIWKSTLRKKTTNHSI